MALLDISEPDAPPAPREQKLAIGIDLGTTNSLVATVRNGIPVVLPDERGHPLLPSIVRYGEAGVDVGYAAQAVQARSAGTIVSVKRLMDAAADLPDERRFRTASSKAGNGPAAACRRQERSRSRRNPPRSAARRGESRGKRQAHHGARYFDDAQRQATRTRQCRPR
jgi:molecular chaperone HscA